MRPNAATLQEYYTRLLAVETLVLVPETGQEGNEATPAARALAPTPGGGRQGGKGGKHGTCRNWGTDAGCKYGRQCRYDHPRLPDGSTQCWTASSNQHPKMNCPVYKSGPAVGTQAGGSDGGGRGDRGERQKPEGKGDGKSTGKHKGKKGEQKGQGGAHRDDGGHNGGDKEKEQDSKDNKGGTSSSEKTEKQCRTRRR